MSNPKIPVRTIEREPLIELTMPKVSSDGTYMLTTQQARDLRIDLGKSLDKLDGLA